MGMKFVFNELTAICGDYKFYAANEPSIDKWLWEYGCKRQGMVITFCDEQAKIMFMLRWV
jgi:hypothetical protein